MVVEAASDVARSSHARTRRWLGRPTRAEASPQNSMSTVAPDVRHRCQQICKRKVAGHSGTATSTLALQDQATPLDDRGGRLPRLLSIGAAATRKRAGTAVPGAEYAPGTGWVAICGGRLGGPAQPHGPRVMVFRVETAAGLTVATRSRAGTDPRRRLMWSRGDRREEPCALSGARSCSSGADSPACRGAAHVQPP